MAIQTTSINDLMQLINAMSAGSRQKTIEQNNLIKDFSFGIEGIFDDKKLADKKKIFDDYYSANELNMTKETRVQYELVAQKFKNQEEMNKNYIIDREEIKSIGTQVESALVDYSNISTTQTPNYSNISTSQTPNWQEVA